MWLKAEDVSDGLSCQLCYAPQEMTIASVGGEGITRSYRVRGTVEDKHFDRVIQLRGEPLHDMGVPSVEVRYMLP